MKKLAITCAGAVLLQAMTLLLAGCGSGQNDRTPVKTTKTKQASKSGKTPAGKPAKRVVAPDTLLERVRSLLPKQGPIDVRWALKFKDRRIVKFWLPPERLTPSESLDVDYLLLLTNRNDLIALQRRSGKMAWWTHLSGPPTGNPAFTKFGVYLVVRSHIICLELYSGEVVWRLNLEFPPSSGPSVFEPNQGKPIVHIAGLDRKIYAIEVEKTLWPPKHGAGSVTRKDFVMEENLLRILWRYSTYSQIIGDVVYWDHQIYAADALYNVYAIKSSELSIGKPKHVQLYRTQGPITVSPTIIGQYLFVPCRDRNLYCLRRQDISPNWHYAAGFLLETPVYELLDHFINRTTVVLKCGIKGPLTGLRDTDGKVMWELKDGLSVVGLFVDPENELNKRAIMVVRNHDKSLSGHYASSGEQIWRIPAAAFAPFCINAREELIFCGVNSGQVICALQRKK